MNLSDFDFDLPEELIATRPALPRSSARLLVAQGGEITDAKVGDIVGFLRPGDRLVLNDTKVIPARLFGKRTRETGQGPATAEIEVTLLEPRSDATWVAMIKPLRKLKDGEMIVFGDNLAAEFLGREDSQGLLRFTCDPEELDDAIEAQGRMPLPPYIESIRPADEQDREDYQTVWARHKGAVAAPTASLHFDKDLLAKIAAAGVDFTHVTLHVGAGTFLPVKVEDVSEHKMHAEWGQVGKQAAEEINATKKAGGRIIAVGTTALRLIETAADEHGNMSEWEGKTDIFIKPGYRFKTTDALITNFHLPKSTLLMLVSALVGKDVVDEIYAHAIEQRYRFFSYGDASFLTP